MGIRHHFSRACACALWWRTQGQANLGCLRHRPG